MKKLIAIFATVLLLASACGSTKQSTDYDKVDESFEEFKDRNPDSD